MKQVERIIKHTFGFGAGDVEYNTTRDVITGYGYVGCDAGEGLLDENGNQLKNYADVRIEADKNKISVSDFGMDITHGSAVDKDDILVALGNIRDDFPDLYKWDLDFDHRGDSHVKYDLNDNLSAQMSDIDPNTNRPKYINYQKMADDIRTRICGIINSYTTQCSLRNI